MDRRQLRVRFAEELWLFLAPRDRRAELRLPYDGTASLGHVIESAGVPLRETGAILAGERPVSPSHRPSGGDVLAVLGVRRPQPIPASRFLLDVHLGTLARRLRLVGVDTAYRNDADDDTLIAQAAAGRVLLTQDRGLLRRRGPWVGAYVRGSHPDDQFRDVLDRFAPPLAPWTRCTACNGPLSRVGKSDVEADLLPGTRRSYDVFARCLVCGHVYWRGAHGDRLEQTVRTAAEIVSARRSE